MEDTELMEQTTPEETTGESSEATEESTDDSDLGNQQGGDQQQETQPEEPKYKVKYNGEEMELGVSDLTTYAQKGMNYDHVHEDLENTRKTSKQTQSQLERITSVLNQLGYTGSAQEIADMLEAQSREVEPSQVRSEREALEAQELAKQEAEAARAEAERIRAEATFARDLAEIQRLNPNIKTLNDLGETFFRLRAAGVDNLEAYELVHKPKGSTKQRATGKEHIQPTGGGASSGGLVDIPQSDLGIWKDMFPDDTPAKLKERYNRAKKRQGE